MKKKATVKKPTQGAKVESKTALCRNERERGIPELENKGEHETSELG